MRIGYFADGAWSHRALEKILSDKAFSVEFVCARFDNPDPILKEMSLALDIPFFIHENINSDAFLEDLNQYNCDVYVSMSFNQIFKSSIINHTSNGIINCHAGKLPFYRGRNVLNWALINDEKDFGVTVHYVDDGVDTGDIINQQSYSITEDDDYSTLLARSYGYCSEVLYKSLLDLERGQAKRISQRDIHPVGFYCSQRKVGDEILSWKKSSREIFNFARALCMPGPQARAFIAGAEIKINKIELVPDAPIYKGIPGAVLGIERGNLLVKTEDSFVKVVQWSSDIKIRVGDRLE
jgi:methionyl-tRNA formyltransferase